MSIAPIAAVVFSFAIILVANSLEGGHLSSLLQPTAAMIVFGGTLGATWLTATNEELKHLLHFLPKVVRPDRTHRGKLVEAMVTAAKVVRREGMLALEKMLPEVENAFLRRGLQSLADGGSPEDVRRLLETELEIEHERGVACGKIFEAAGGYSPTVGILGAVLGLIHVMRNLADPSMIGSGIAVAFVATVYGVGFANLLFIPLGARLKKIAGAEAETRTMVLMGLSIIATGAHPRQVEEILSAYLSPKERPQIDSAGQ